MSAHQPEHDGYGFIRLGAETGVVVPLDEDRALAALRDRASAEDVEDASRVPRSLSTRTGRQLDAPAEPSHMTR